jgi:ribosomal protein S18 acetylase RimI-like enzyme
MSATIVRFLACEDRKEILKEVREIFFESSGRKDFKDEQEKEDFYHKYLGHYIGLYPELVWIAREEKVLGYVVVALETPPSMYRIQPHLEVFEAYFEQFPAHLHINCHKDSRGKGIGRSLISEVLKHLKGLNISGLHIMTSPDSPNRAFYQRLGFDFEVTQNFGGTPILFMGKNKL